MFLFFFFFVIFIAVQQRQSTRNSSDTSQNQGTSSPTESKSKVLKQKVKKVPSSDAILSCPACMTTLCIDCQRSVNSHHRVAKNLYQPNGRVFEICMLLKKSSMKCKK